MAVVLDALAPYVKKIITDMAKEEVRMLLGVPGEINKLKDNLVYLQDYLADAERRRVTDVSVQSWDVIQPLVFCLQNPLFAHETGSRIKKLNQELDSIRKGAAQFNFLKLGSYEEKRTPTDSTAQARRKTTSGFDESAIVGEKIQRDTENLVQKLIMSNNRHDSSASTTIKVVSIVGPGGMGKSTLARKILANEAIKEEFKTKIWLSVTQKYEKVELLRNAITQAKKEPAKGKDESFLEETLTDALSANKFLLVLDDLWTDGAWKEVLHVPVVSAARKQPGSRVLLTTRNEDVTLKMGHYHSHSDQLHVSKLDDEDAWSLLKKQLPRQRQVGIAGDYDELKDIGMKIIKKCDGLPLAIKVMGGLLSTRRPKEREWEIVLNKNIEWKKDEAREEEELNYSVRLSYEDLSPQLKQCFLYYSLFPKGSGFIEERVISMWISEGFVQHDGRSESGQLDLEDIGAEYHRELVARNLLEPDDSTDNIWDYTMHDIVRSFAQFMSREEAFVVHEDQADIRSLLPENKRFRRLSIDIVDSELEWSILEQQETLRTLLLISCDIKPIGSLQNFASLRVLEISSVQSDWLVDSLCQLRHLRYLSLSYTDISRLPHDIHKMWFLQHIQLDNCTKLEKLPDSITKLVGLRNLSLTGSKVDTIPRGFGVKMDGDWCTLEELEALSHLRSLQVNSLENVLDSSIVTKAGIRSKKHLEYLELNWYVDDDDDDDEEEEEEEEEEDGDDRDDNQDDEVEEQQEVEKEDDEKEEEEEHEDDEEKEEDEQTEVENIDQDKEEDDGHTEDDGLCRIPGLEELLISNAPAIEHVGPDFQSVASGDGRIVSKPFPELVKLELLGLSVWKEWNWEKHSEAISMAALEHLQLTDCKLTHLPPGLACDYRYSLRSICLKDLTQLEYLENFPSVVKLDVHECPMLKTISSFSMLRTVNIDGCQKLKVLEGVPVLDNMVLDDIPWDVIGTPARCRPKGYQAGLQRQLPQDLTIIR
ncbi:unnamed protein product [Miscanthus lutarioriparius]|uniref:Uncharacterized protein n=1 Tax=Miscanthus lutarioriparius TaxID=422564 RepID=A0A811Q2L1_9POAL|nr:unnamed protein product [Miscanthus lutarioriparius]